MNLLNKVRLDKVNFEIYWTIELEPTDDWTNLVWRNRFPGEINCSDRGHLMKTTISNFRNWKNFFRKSA